MPIVEQVIDSLGIEAGINKYYELENTNTGMYIFSEKNTNFYGYKYLNAEKYCAA